MVAENRDPRHRLSDAWAAGERVLIDGPMSTATVGG